MQTKTCLILLVLLFASLSQAGPLETVFTYQGELQESDSPANGEFDFEFALFNVMTSGSAIDTVIIENVLVNEGNFSTGLDFAETPFAAGEQYWIEVRVRTGASTGGFQQLLPRQKLTATPYALSALSVVGGGIPASAVMFFNLASCPAGWTDFSALEGRVAVGTPTGGTLEQVVGGPLGDGGSRTISGVPSHSHTTNTAGSHAHTVTPVVSVLVGGGHTPTSQTEGDHTHTGTAVSAGSHDHTLSLELAGSFGTFGVSGVVNSSGGNVSSAPMQNGGAHTHPVTVDGSGDHTHPMDAVTDHGHNLNISESTASTENAHGHMINASGSASIDVTMPYVQLKACIKL